MPTQAFNAFFPSAAHRFNARRVLALTVLTLFCGPTWPQAGGTPPDKTYCASWRSGPQIGCFWTLAEAEAALRASDPDLGPHLERTDEFNPDRFVYYVALQPPAVFYPPVFGTGPSPCPGDPASGVRFPESPPPCRSEPTFVDWYLTEVVKIGVRHEIYRYTNLNPSVVGAYPERPYRFDRNNLSPIGVLHFDFSAPSSRQIRWEQHQHITGQVHLASAAIRKRQTIECPPKFVAGGQIEDYPRLCRNTAQALITIRLNQRPSCAVNSNPCHPGTGDKSRAEPDFMFAGRPFVRHYHSLRQGRLAGEPLGQGWTHSFAPRLHAWTLMYFNSAGLFETFSYSSGRGHFHMARNKHLDPLPDRTYRLVDTDGSISHFDAKGYLLSLTHPADPVRDLSFDYEPHGEREHRLTTVTDRAGRSLRFQYEGNALVAIALPDDRLVRYEYGPANTLVAVHYPDGSIKRYHYGEASLAANGDPGLLTGITDERGRRYASFGYDRYGRVVLSTLHDAGAPVDTTRVAYVAANQASVTTAGGETRTYQYNTGIHRVPTSVAGANGTSTSRYDHLNRVTEHTDVQGNITRYVYQGPNRSRITYAAGTVAQQRIEIDHESNFNRPTEQRTYDASEALVTREQWQYNDRGQILMHTRIDPSTDASRVTTTTYCEAADVAAGRCPAVGLVLTEDGPRTDVADLTHYSYYPLEAHCPGAGEGPGMDKGCRGQLARITNPAGHVTEFLKYDAHGQLLARRDPDGGEHHYAYDARQRLVRRSHAGLATTYQYDARGLLTTITAPDGSRLTQHYDDAQRLVGLSDTLGNRIRYTLDGAGNRIGETVEDATGSLHQRITREYDALSRLSRERRGVQP